MTITIFPEIYDLSDLDHECSKSLPGGRACFSPLADGAFTCTLEADGH
jgi:hypothetical protein